MSQHRATPTAIPPHPLTVKAGVMKAVMLRDMRTRYFNHGLGYLVGPLWIFVHLLILLGLYSFAGRTTPYGTSLNVYLSTGLIPTLTFMYVSRFMAYSLILNAPMLAFPIVKPSDVMAGRAALEILAAFHMIALTFVFLWAIGADPVPFDIEQAVFAFLAVLLLAVGFGSVVGVLVMINPLLATVYALVLIVFYLASGTLFIASTLPAPVLMVLQWNPVLHAVEWMRTAYYPSYPTQLLDKTYLIGFALVSLACGLGMERLLRRRLLD